MYKHAIVVIHGYRGNSLDMLQITRVLKKLKFFDKVITIDMTNALIEVGNRSYTIGTPMLRFDENGKPLIDHTIIQFTLAQIIPYLEDINKLHFLCYSMGGLLGRAIIKLKLPLPQVVSIVQLATPNLGTEIAGFREGGLSDLLNPNDQLDQMRRNSQFIHWLNSSPTFTGEILHWGVVGEKNAGKIVGFDGLITFDDMNILGLRFIQLGEFASQVDHYNIILWESPIPAIEFIRTQILNLYAELTK